MQLATGTIHSASAPGFAIPESNSAQESRYAQYKVIRRNGSVVVFEPSKIAIAMTKAFIAVNGGQGAGGVRVVNWSVAGTRVPEAIVLLARARELQPDIVLSVFPPNWFDGADYLEGDRPVRLARLESDLSDTAWFYRDGLPREFVGLPNGHEGSHQFLVLDFIELNTPVIEVYTFSRHRRLSPPQTPAHLRTVLSS